MDELIKKLAEVRQQIEALSSMEDLSDKETERLEGLNKEAVKLNTKISALKQVEEGRKAEAARIEAEKTEAVREAVAKAEAAARRPAGGDAPYQAQYSETWKFDTLNAADLSLFIDVMHAAGKQVSPAAVKAMSLRVGELKDDNTEEGRKGINYVKAAFKAATGIEPTMEHIERAVKAATDPMYSGGSTIGSDWVGTAYSNELWRSIRAARQVVEKVPADVIPDGYSSKYWPLESTDPTWYKVAEATASDATMGVPVPTVTASQAATANKQISVAKLGARVLFTQELTEDSLINFAPQLRDQLMVSGAEELEHLFINGDIELSASKNVNDIAGTPGGTETFLLFDGFRKLALVTNTANSRNASGGFVIEDFIDTLKLMGTAGLAGSDPSKVAFIVDPNVHYAAMKLPEVKTRDVHPAATIVDGFLQRAYGVGIIPSWQMHKGSSVRMANSAGKVDLDTASNNAYGAILAVRFDQWKQAYKRRMTMEVTRIANADSWEIVALARIGLAYRDNEASAISYNVGV